MKSKAGFFHLSQITGRYRRMISFGIQLGGFEFVNNPRIQFHITTLSTSPSTMVTHSAGKISTETYPMDV
jgi:hypothetical protein